MKEIYKNHLRTTDYSFSVKIKLIDFLKKQNYSLGFFTEIFRDFNCDVLELTLGKQLIEYEIKTEKQDFKNELFAIDINFNRDDYKKHELRFLEVRGIKFNKHRFYINSNFTEIRKQYPNSFIPNKFYFVIPDELRNLYFDFLDDYPSVPYGLITYNNKINNFNLEKESNLLHYEKVNQELLLRILRFASSECQKLRILLKNKK